jgi:hypothetical protein
MAEGRPVHPAPSEVASGSARRGRLRPPPVVDAAPVSAGRVGPGGTRGASFSPFGDHTCDRMSTSTKETAVGRYRQRRTTAGPVIVTNQTGSLSGSTPRSGGRTTSRARALGSARGFGKVRRSATVTVGIWTGDRAAAVRRHSSTRPVVSVPRARLGVESLGRPGLNVATPTCLGTRRGRSGWLSASPPGTAATDRRSP